MLNKYFDPKACALGVLSGFALIFPFQIMALCLLAATALMLYIFFEDDDEIL